MLMIGGRAFALSASVLRSSVSHWTGAALRWVSAIVPCGERVVESQSRDR